MTDKKYISEKGSVDTELNSFIESKIQGGTMIIMTTEKFECCTQKKIEDTEHLLELRVFTESKELKIPRGKTRTGSSPVSGTIERMSILRHSFLVF